VKDKQMAAKIISVGNQKGGVGKTTVTMQLAGALSRDYKVLVADADEQATASKWAAMAEGEPFPAAVVGLAAAGAKIHRELQRLSEQYDFILVDCPPSVSSPVPQAAFLVSDLVLIPTRPSLPDIWAVQETLRLVERAKVINESIKSAILVNALQPNTQLGRDAVEIINQFDAYLLKTSLHQRQAYPQSVVLGGTVSQVSGAKPAQAEVQALVKELLSLLELQ
jgi:chromosome partitioning protein